MQYQDRKRYSKSSRIIINQNISIASLARRKPKRNYDNEEWKWKSNGRKRKNGRFSLFIKQKLGRKGNKVHKLDYDGELTNLIS